MELAKEKNNVEESIYQRYEYVRSKGCFNMIMDATQAMKAAHLTEDEYWFVINNYNELRTRYKGKA